MKKFLFSIALFISAGLIFAESYTVKSVVGIAKIQTGSDKWAELYEGRKVESSDVVTTGLNSILFITDDVSGKDIKIKANQKGSVEVLAKSALYPAAGIKKAKINTASVAGASSTSGKGVATASSRASEAKEDIDWDE